jgi:iron complex outermembrane receptor protein
MKRVAVFTLNAAAATISLAQTFPPVTVTATRTEQNPFDVPASVSVIDGDELRAAGRPELSLSESIASVPGVNARDRQNYAQDMQLSIRGFGARSTFGVRGVRIYVDGIPATMPDGQGQTSNIDLASAGKVEVLRGPFSVLWGNSSGGVVEVDTEPGQGAPRLTANVISGSDGLEHPGLRLTGSSGNVGYVFSANHLGLDGYREHSSVTRDIGNARIDIKAGEGRTWTLVANSVDLRADDPLGLSRAQLEAAPQSVDAAAITFDTRKTVHQQQLGLIHEARLSAEDRLRVLLYAGTRGTQQFQSIPVAPQLNPLHPGGVIGLDRDYAGTDIRWTHKAGVALEVVGGLAYDRMREHRRGWQNFIGTDLGVQGALRRDEDNTVDNIDPYLQGVWKAGDRWTLTAGVRHSSVRFRSSDHYIAGANGDDSGSVRYSATLPAIATMFAVTTQLHAYAAYGRGFETPTLNELAYRPGGAPGLNFALNPSTSNNVEIGLKGREAARFEWNAALFDTHTKDEIVVLTNTGGRSTFRNAGSTRRRGVEFDGSVKIARDTRLQLAQTFVDAFYDDGNRIPGVARSFTALELARRPTQGWQAGAELRHSSRVWVNDANSEAAPSFTTVALDAGYAVEIHRWSVSAAARVDNVFNRRYAGSVIVNEGNGRYYEPAPGRNYTVKLTGTYAF